MARPRVQAWSINKTTEDHAQAGHLVDLLKWLHGLRVLYWKLDADKSNDPGLGEIRKGRNYSWTDITTICKNKHPNYEEKIKMFNEEDLHLDGDQRDLGRQRVL